MSVKLLKLVEAYQKPLIRSEYYILRYLAGWGKDDGTNIHPGLARIAKETRYCERNVQYRLRSLEQKGLLIAESKAGGRGHFSHYRISLEVLQPVTLPVTPDKPTPPPEIPSSNVPPDFDSLELPPVTDELEEKLLFDLRDWERKAKSRPESDFFRKKRLEAEERYQKFREEKQRVPTT